MKKRIYFIWVLLLPFIMQAQSSSTTDEVKRLVARAKTAYSMGEFQDALIEYQKAQELIPNYPDLYKAIGDVYEKLGGDNDLKMAIESYEQYLKLSPQATDKDEIQEKIASLEYKFEKQVKQTQIFDDLTGYWKSNLVTIKPLIGKMTQASNIPYVILDIKEIQKTGKYRVTIRPECGMYRESIIEKTINIIPEKDNSFRFIFADAQTYTPSGAKYDLMRVGASFIGNDIAQTVAQIGVNALQSGDLPSNTQTAYDFHLKYDSEYNNGILDGLYNVIGKHSNPNTSQTTDNLNEIYFTKQRIVMGINYNLINEQLMQEKKLNVREGLYVTNVVRGTYYDSGGFEEEFTAAWTAGIKQGDIITEINGIKVKSKEDLEEQMKNFRLGDEIILKGFRDKKEKKFKLKLKDLAPLKPRVGLGADLWIIDPNSSVGKYLMKPS